VTLDRRHFLAAGASALLLPGCATRPISAALPADLAWTKLPTVPFRGKQDDIAFGSAKRGWFGNGEGRLYRTEDGGDGWAQVWHRPGTFVRALGFLDQQRGVMGNVGVGSFPNVTDTRPLYRTEDGGATWLPAEAIDGPVPAGICAIEIVRSAFIDRGERAERTTVHAAGRVGGPAHYLRSTDGGRSWTSRDLGALAAAIYDVKFVNPKTGFLAASSGPDLAAARGLILRTDDGGETWHEAFRSARPFETVWKLHFPTARRGYGSVQSYDPDPARTQRFVAASEDGGRSWHEVPLVADAKWRSFGIGFADEKTGWVGGNLGGMETRDGGATWRAVDMGKAVNKIRFVGTGAERRAFAVGSDVYRLELG
jgi:photosystem II stability/assembly factor-like uncharacterized protein